MRAREFIELIRGGCGLRRMQGTPYDLKCNNAVGLARKAAALDRRDGNPDPACSRLVDDAPDAAP
jgi:hypothetical protein